METAVYLFTGFLEGGKTHIIQESMADERFNTGEKTLIILCEEGIEELDISAGQILKITPDGALSYSTFKYVEDYYGFFYIVHSRRGKEIRV